VPYLKAKPVAPPNQLIESVEVQEVLHVEDQKVATKTLSNTSAELVFYKGDRFTPSC